MKREIYVIFGQRKESYPGQHAPEALEVVDDFSHDENPDWIASQLAEYRRKREFENVEVMLLSLDDAKIQEALRPTTTAIETEVIERIEPDVGDA